MSKRNPKSRKKPVLSTDDLALWQRVTAGIAPLPGRRERLADLLAEAEQFTDGPAQPPRPLRRATGTARLPTAVPVPAKFNLPDLEVGAAPGLDKRTAQRLRRGRLAVEARLDLHGHTLEQAHLALNSFVAGAQAADRRCVIVVTGKGVRGEGKIRAAVPQWLNAAPNRQRILSFSHAQPKDGGDGALYVLLRKRK